MTLGELNDIRIRWDANRRNDIRYYVYLYRYPVIPEHDKSGSVFYVGMGNGDRVFAHMNEGIDDRNQTDKLRVINELASMDIVPDIEIVRDNLTEEQAKEIESAVIDAIGLDNLTNRIRGWNSTIHKIQNSQYVLQDAEFQHNMLGVVIRNTYPHNFPNLDYNPEDDRHWQTLYEISRWCWRVAADAREHRGLEYYFVTHNCRILEVYRLIGIVSVADAIDEGDITIENNRVTGGFQYYNITDDVDVEIENRKKILIGERACNDIRGMYVGRRVQIGQLGFQYFAPQNLVPM